jgi:hypothetical protein
MTRRILLGVTLAVFLAQTVMVLTGIGFVGFLESANVNEATRLMFFDVVITLVLITVWMRQDAQATGRKFWPFAILTLVLGSAGPLAYLLARTCSTQCPVPTRNVVPPQRHA